MPKSIRSLVPSLACGSPTQISRILSKNLPSASSLGGWGVDIAFLYMTQLNQETYIYGPNTLSKYPLKVYMSLAELTAMACTYYVPGDGIYAGIGLYKHLIPHEKPYKNQLANLIPQLLRLIPSDNTSPSHMKDSYSHYRSTLYT